ncbi:MAG: hypothetical protein F4Y47_01560 [Acidobacteriia bacterium]|nr:hypothetical protein [Terriglobia bacterium]MYK11992.1 hypothetical protein [Terriglobia bacterium]
MDPPTLPNWCNRSANVAADCDREAKRGALICPRQHPSEAFRILRSRTHGHVLAACHACRQLGLPQLVASQPCPQRDLVCAMIAARILRSQTKLATASWHSTSLPDFSDLCHLAAGGLVLLDLSSSYFEGVACPLARFGLQRVVLVGDRGMLAQTRIDQLRELD